MNPSAPHLNFRSSSMRLFTAWRSSRIFTSTMKYAVSPLLFSVGSYAAAIKQSQCYFELEASGGALGYVGQTNNGYSRIGGDRSPATYYISNGVITDSTGHGYFSPWANSDFGSDKDKSGAAHSGSFSIGGDGKLFYNGNNKFYACPAEKGEYDIRTYSDGHAKCVDVTFSTNGKCASGENGYGYDKHGHADLKRDDKHNYGDKKYHDGAQEGR
ncbi:hypothetical protein B0J12DRAFT_444121 [Macrophomina phaseolina]|uniref:Cell wall mannoprotein PIR1-like C-terminal domain-containing protein n=1 Tax=Macrophomina phaseolina TaxID=35725 RepID=A0ABQ8FQT7_9PEZI|nr:hypothetical protein B0J12DRAFT_444121 [Macrophomina phaseolina]